MRIKNGLALAMATILFSSSVIANEGMHKFENIDKNSDGVISKSEFLDNAEQKFTNMDADNDGKLTKDEKKAWKAKHKNEKSDS